jgi:uncharacterized membrane protein
MRGTRRAWLVTIAALGALVLLVEPAGATVTHVPAVPIAGMAVTHAISPDGVIVGTTDFFPMHLVVTDPKAHTVTDLGPLGTFDFLQVNAVTDNGLVVGTGFSGTSLAHAFSYDLNTHTLTDLNPLFGGDGSVALGAQPGGVVFGARTIEFGPDAGEIGIVALPSEGLALDVLPPPGDTRSVVVGAFGRGQVVGASWSGGGSILTGRGFVYDALGRTYTTIPTVGGVITTSPRAVSRSGEVVGGWGGGDAFSYDASTGTTTDLGTLPGDTGSQAWGVDRLGNIVGESTGTTCRAFVWTPKSGGTMTQIGPSSTDNWFATAISDRGTIALTVESPTSDQAELAHLPRALRGP